MYKHQTLKQFETQITFLKHKHQKQHKEKRQSAFNNNNHFTVLNELNMIEFYGCEKKRKNQHK